jgi:beta-carotene hydroxylase
MSGRHHYARHARELKHTLRELIPAETLRELHVNRPWRHFLVVARLVALSALATATIVLTDSLWLTLPAMVVQGFVFFNCTILLHEAIHDAVFVGRHERLARVLGFAYAFPAGMSASQFTRWHLDHHDELGDPEGDPKRHHLSPKKNSRLLKAAYWTFLLIPIYFRAARREVATYPPDLRRRIARERTAVFGGHLAIFALLWALAGARVALMAHLLPYLVVFPMAFALNRLGQHYDIDPADVARWSTRMRPSPVWDFAFLWSNYHLEHHYFPRVPFYNLPRLAKLLKPFYEQRGVPERTYGQLVWAWFVRNEAPHSRWGTAAPAAPAPVVTEARHPVA